MKIKYVALIALAIPLVACETARESSAEDRYAETLEEFGIIPEHGTRAELIDLAGLICDAYAHGISDREASQIMIESGFTATDGGYVVGAAQAAFCPEYA